jgi:hypothetical protein
VPWIHRSGVTVAILRHQTPDRATCVDRDANARAPPAASVLPVHCTYLLNCRDRIGWAGSNTIAVNEGEARRMYVRTRTPANDRRAAAVLLDMSPSSELPAFNRQEEPRSNSASSPSLSSRRRTPPVNRRGQLELRTADRWVINPYPPRVLCGSI